MPTEPLQPVDTSPGSSDQAWQKDEHVSGSVQAQAKALVEQAGSIELAKHAVDAVTPTTTSGDPKDTFARDQGFASYLELFETATPVHSTNEQTWLLAATPAGQWVAWTEQDLATAQMFDSMESALTSVSGGAGTGT